MAAAATASLAGRQHLQGCSSHSINGR
jgi:hypothetical protein